MTAPHTPNQVPQPLSPEQRLVNEPLTVPAPGTPRTLDQERAELNTVTDAITRIISAETDATRYEVGQNRVFSPLDIIAHNGMIATGTDDYGRAIRDYQGSAYRHKINAINHKYQTGDAEIQLKQSIDNGNTGLVVALLDRLAGNTVVSDAAAIQNRTDVEADYRLATTETTHASREAARVSHTIQPHGLNKPAVPDYFDPHKVRQAYERDSQAFVSAETRIRETLAQPRIDYAKHDRARRDMEPELQRAAERVAVSSALRERMAPLFADERQQYAERLTRLADLERGVRTELGTWDWSFEGTPVPISQDARIATLIQGWGQELSDMSTPDSNRHESYGRRITETVRYLQRRALNLPGDNVTDLPQFSQDRGVIVEGTDGKYVLYEDGSFVKEGGIRRTPNGAKWQPETEAPQPSVTTEELQDPNLTPDQILQFREQAIDQWETNRTPETEVDAAMVSREAVNRMYALHSEDTRVLGETQSALATAGANYDAAVKKRDQDIDYRVTEHMLANPAADRAAIRHNVTNQVTAETQADIAKLDAARQAAEVAAQNAQAAEGRAREDVNHAEYRRRFFAITRKKEAGTADDGSTTQITARGLIAIENGVLNDVRGNWLLDKDGSACLFNPDDGSATEYLPNGQPKP